MGETTGIAWTDHTFNPWWGCVRVSPACQHCYAETFAKRTGHDVWGVQSPRRFFGEKHWNEPRRWHERAIRDGVRRRVFCASMADVFERHQDPSVDADMAAQREQLWRLIRETPLLTWQLLTKRPENIAAMLPADLAGAPNVWLGTTVESDEYADQRVPHLLAVNAVVHFVSYEPALGPVDLTPWMDHECGDPPHGRCPNQIRWVIAGGESGPGFRAPDVRWFTSMRDQCASHRVAFFFKQHGGLRPTSQGCLLDGREVKQFPDDE